MNHKFFALAAVAAAFSLFAVSCEEPEAEDPQEQKKEDPGTPTPPTPVEVRDTFTFVLPDASSSTEVLSLLTWKDNDKIYVGDKTFTLFEGAGTKTAKFAGDHIDASKISVYYPDKEFASLSFAGQTQTANASFGHFPVAFVLDGVSVPKDHVFNVSVAGAEANRGVLRATQALKLVLSKVDGLGTIKEVSVEAQSEIFHTSNDPSSTASKLTLAYSGPEADVYTLYLGLPEFPVIVAEGSTLAIEVKDANSVRKAELPMAQALSIADGTLLTVELPAGTSWFNPSAGNGSKDSPLQISTVDELNALHSQIAPGQTTYVELAADIDLSSIDNWEPLNAVDPFDKAVHFDGKGYKISNMKSTDNVYTSFFGVLNGTVQNVTFENCTLSTSNGHTIGVVAAYGGNAGGTIVGEALNVKCVGCTVTDTFSNLAAKGVLGVGGAFGTVGTGTYRNIVFEGTVNNLIKCADETSNDVRACTGGFCGDLRLATAVIENVTVKGEINSQKGRYTGGIVGYARTKDTKIRNCTNEAKVTSSLDRVGGICGHFQSGEITGCVNKGEIVSTFAYNQKAFVGGIMGVSSEPTLIEGCTNTGNVTVTGQYAGGIMGASESTVVVRRCSSDSKVRGAQFVGGISGAIGVGALDVTGKYSITIENCWTGGSLDCYNGQCGGGIIGEMPAANSSVRNCWSEMAVTGQRVLGGILGRSCAKNATATGWDTTFAISDGSTAVPTIQNCIAWNPSIVCTDLRQYDACGGSGAVIGYTSFKNKFGSCYRNPSMAFTPSDSRQSFVDQPDCDGTNWVLGTTEGTAETYCAPYHGKAAESKATVSSIAKTLKWDETVWDLSGDKPVLK